MNIAVILPTWDSTTISFQTLIVIIGKIFIRTLNHVWWHLVYDDILSYTKMFSNRLPMLKLYNFILFFLDYMCNLTIKGLCLLHSTILTWKIQTSDFVFELFCRFVIFCLSFCLFPRCKSKPNWNKYKTNFFCRIVNWHFVNWNSCSDWKKNRFSTF